MAKTNTKTKKSQITTKTVYDQKLLKPWIYGVFAVFFALVAAYAFSLTKAAAYQLYLTPSTSNVNVGDTVTVAIRIDPGTAINAVSAVVGFDPALLQYVATDAANSSFPVEVYTKVNANSIQLDRGIFSNTVSTDSLVASITFKTLAATSGTNLILTGNASTPDGVYTNPTTGSISTIVASTSTPPPPPTADTTQPTVTITSPLNGASSRDRFNIQANATDNVAVTKMEVYIDNSIWQTTTSSSVSYRWSIKSKRITKGTHLITVKAYDAAGNIGSSNVTVTKL